MSKDLVTALTECIDGVLDAKESAEGAELHEVISEFWDDFKKAEASDEDTSYPLVENEHKVVLAVWEHIKMLLEETPMGEVVREVFAQEYLGITPSFDKPKALKS